MASEDLKLCIHSRQFAADAQTAERKTPPTRRIRFQMSFQDRLLRNSTIACALLLGILALSSLHQPWAVKTSAQIEKALTMEIDPDRTLGQLSFVKRIVPESAYVFFNLDQRTELDKPVQAEVTHPYSDQQPWIMFHADTAMPVCAAKDGVISAVSPLDGGGFGILIDHGGGLKSITACVDRTDMQEGAEVKQGESIGEAEGSVYFELRENDEPVDPTERMGL